MLGPSLHEEKNTCRPGPTRTSVSKMTPVIKGFSTSRPILTSPQADPHQGRSRPRHLLFCGHYRLQAVIVALNLKSACEGSTGKNHRRLSLNAGGSGG